MDHQTAKKRFDVISVGDCVMDCISYIDRLPKMGETMMSNSFICSPGGCGANGVVAASRLGSNCAFVSKVGNDMFGKEFMSILKAEKIDTENVTVTSEAATSVASVLVDKEALNTCVVSYGSTLLLSDEDINMAEDAIKLSKVLVTTLMTPNATLHSLKIAKKHNLITIFNFVPPNKDLVNEFNQYVDLLVVNQNEAEVFSGCGVKTVDDAKKACSTILGREGFFIGVIVTLGEDGIVFGVRETNEIGYIPATKVDAVDTTGAGDAFVGSLAHFINRVELNAQSLKKCIQLASEYATLTVLKQGTQVSYPRLAEIDPKFSI